MDFPDGRKWPGHKADRSPAFNAVVKNVWSHISNFCTPSWYKEGQINILLWDTYVMLYAFSWMSLNKWLGAENVSENMRMKGKTVEYNADDNVLGKWNKHNDYTLNCLLPVAVKMGSLLPHPPSSNVSPLHTLLARFYIPKVFILLRTLHETFIYTHA